MVAFSFFAGEPFPVPIQAQLSRYANIIRMFTLFEIVVATAIFSRLARMH